MNLAFVKASVFAAALIVALGVAPAYGQSLLENQSAFATVVGLNTVPGHGDIAVSFLDYRNAGFVIMAVDIATGDVHELERVFYAEPVVSTFGHRIAWIGYTPMGRPDVYVHDRTTGKTANITSNAAFQNHPYLSGDVLVWQDYRNAGAGEVRADVFMHDFGSGTTSPVTTDPGYQDLPRIHGNRIVWQDYRHADSLLQTADIYAFDLTTQDEARLTSGTYYRTNPAVWSHLVVWEDYRNGNRGDIYLYDFATEQEMAISTHEAHQSHPAVYGDWVLWLDYRNDNAQADIYGYNVKTRQEYALVIHPAHQEAPHVYANHVVWQDYRDERYDLYSGTLADPTTTPIEGERSQGPGRLAVAPNPFIHSVTFTLTAPPALPLQMTIYDVLGRTIARRTISSDEVTARWDGINDAGMSVGAGVYIAVVKGPDVMLQIAFVRHR